MKKNTKLTVLIGQRVFVEISEPWELSTKLENTTIEGKIEDIKDDTLLLQLDYPLKIKNKECNKLLISNRYEGETFSSYRTGIVLTVSISAIPNELSETPDPFTLSTWKYGLGLIGTVKIGK